EADALAARAQFLEPFGLPRPVAALRDGDVDDVPFCFAQQPQRQPPDDYFVIGVRRKNQRLRRARGDGRLGTFRKPTERPAFALFSETAEFRDKVVIGVHVSFVVVTSTASLTASPA